SKLSNKEHQHSIVDNIEKETKPIHLPTSSQSGEIEKLPTLQFLEDIKPILGGLEDALHTLNRQTLESYALTAEKYLRQQKGQQRLLGGLHDYIKKLSNGEIGNY